MSTGPILGPASSTVLYVKGSQYILLTWMEELPGGTSGKEPSYQRGDTRYSGPIPWSGKSPGGGHGNPLQSSCLENPVDRGAWWTTVHGGHTELDMTEMTQHSTQHVNGNGQTNSVL